MICCSAPGKAVDPAVLVDDHSGEGVLSADAVAGSCDGEDALRTLYEMLPGG